MKRIVLGLLILGMPGCGGNKTPNTNPRPERVPENTKSIDLAVLPIDSQFISITAGTYYVEIQNLAPANTYAISARVQTITLPPIQIAEVAPRLSVAGTSTACQSLKTAVEALARETEEAAIPRLVNQVEAANTATCTDASLKAEAIRRIEGTTRLLGPFRVQQGQLLNVTVARAAGAPRWARTYSAGERGRWVATYGFNYVWTGFSPNRRYFVEETGTAGTYEITSRRSKEFFELAPSLFYTWLAADEELDNWDGGPTVGLGFDFEAPVVSVGYSLTYNQNATLSAGLSLHQVRRLTERYEVGQQVDALIGDEELFRNVYRVNPYVAVTIRSITNPFQRPESPDE